MAKELTRKEVLRLLEKHEANLAHVAAIVPGMLEETREVRAKIEGKPAPPKQEAEKK